MEDTGGGDAAASAVSKSTAVVACAAMTFFYVAILYAPTVILRLPPPPSFSVYMIRRFVCAAVSTAASLTVCALILPIRRWEAEDLFGAYGIRLDHIWEAVILPLSLTYLLYAGSIILKFWVLLDSWKEHCNHGGSLSFEYLKNVLRGFISRMLSFASTVSAWRIYFVAPLTEELVFRACMIPLLLCGGFKTYTVVLLSPIFFSLAHLNHFWEFYTQQNYSLLKASMVVCFQLGYTVIFGSYASFLFIRTGHFAAPFITHMFCNFMGLPVIFSRKTGMVSVVFAAGLLGFFYLVFPLTSPGMYNNRTDICKCWHRFCSWS